MSDAPVVPLPDESMKAPVWLRRGVQRMESAGALDRVASLVGDAARPVSGGTAGEALRGQWLGHALHPLLTDLPLGCWIGAGLLDVVGGRNAAGAARRLVGLGLVVAVPTALSGLAEFTVTHDPAPRRVGAVHAMGNVVVVALYGVSWWARRRSRRRGVTWGLAGGALASATGYLGGHLSFARAVGVGGRGFDTDSPASSTAS